MCTVVGSALENREKVVGRIPLRWMLGKMSGLGLFTGYVENSCSTARKSTSPYKL